MICHIVNAVLGQLIYCTELRGAIWSILTIADGFQAVARSILTTPKYCLPFLQPGRLIRLQMPEFESLGVDGNPLGEWYSDAPDLWGVVVNFQRITKTSEGHKDNAGKDINVDCDFLMDVLVNSRSAKGHSGEIGIVCSCAQFPCLASGV